MKPIRNLMWFCVGLLISVGLFYMPYAHAQMAPYPSVAGPFSPYPPQYNPYLPNPATGAPSAASVANATGVSATQSGSATVTLPNGVKLPVPVSQTANVAKAAIAQAARLCFSNLAAAAVCGATAAAAAAVADKSICFSTVIPGMPYVCKENPATQPDPIGAGYIWASSGITGPSPLEVCKAAYASSGPLYEGTTYSYGLANMTATSGLCKRTYLPTGSDSSSRGVTRLSSCATNFSLQGSSCVYTGPQLPPVPMTDSELGQTLQEKMDADFNNNRKLYDAMKKDEADNPNRDANLNPITSDTPVSVNAPPVTSPERDVSVTQSPKPDGSVDTTTVKEKTTVTPTTTGTTQGTVKTTFPSSTTTTTTITNNVTNIATTTTNVTNNVPAESEPAPEQEDPCKGNPDRAGCAKLGTPPVAQDIPKLDIPVSVTPVVFASSASCPPDLTYEAFGARSISYVPLCNKMTEVRPIFLALGAFASAIIVMGFFRI